MLNYNNTAFDYSENFKFNLAPIPNILSDIIIVLLGKIFPIQIASKIFYTLYIMLFPITFLFFLRAVDKRLAGYVFVSFSFLFSYFTFMGNENFILSLILFFTYWTMILNKYSEKSLKHKILFFVVAGLLYFAHMFTFYIACVSTVIFYLARKDIRKFFEVLLYLAPFVILFFIWQFGTGGSIFLNKKFISEMLISHRKLNTLSVMFASYIGPFFRESILTLICVAILCMFFKIFSCHSAIVKSIFYSFLGIMINIFLPTTFLFFGPDQRAVFLAFLFGAVLLPVRKGIRTFFVLSFVALSIFSVTQNIRYFKDAREQLDYMVPLIEKMPPQKRVLPVMFKPYTWVPYIHRIYEYYHIENGGINPYHFFTKSNLVMYKEKQFKPPLSHKGPQDYPDGFFEDYDIILIIGDKITDNVMSYIAFIREKGFKTYCINSRTLNALSK